MSIVSPNSRLWVIITSRRTYHRLSLGDKDFFDSTTIFRCHWLSERNNIISASLSEELGNDRMHAETLLDDCVHLRTACCHSQRRWRPHSRSSSLALPQYPLGVFAAILDLSIVDRRFCNFLLAGSIFSKESLHSKPFLSCFCIALAFSYFYFLLI
jgi:hypothetical protein